MSTKHNKQKEVSFSQLMRSVDDTLHTEEQISEKQPQPQSQPQVENTSVEKSTTPEITSDQVVQKDKDGATVVKPHVENIAKTFTEAASQATQQQNTQKINQANQSTEVEIITKKVEGYLNFNTGLIMQDQNKKQKAGELFRDILFYATDHPTKEVLDVVYRFFKKNRDKILAPEIALPGTLYFKRDITERISCIYTLFRGLVEDKPFKLNMATTRVLLHMNDNNKIDSLLTYFESKQK